MNYEQALSLLKAHNQEQLLQYYCELDEEGKKRLLGAVKKIDFSVLGALDGEEKRPLGKLEPADTLTLEEIEKNKEEYEKVGLAALKNGKVAAVLLAGGQGSRLGFSGPKGVYNIGVTCELSIFECQFHTIKSVANRTGKPFHIFIMTSEINDGETRAFFETNNYFGYDKSKVHFYVQDATVACSLDGKFLLAEKDMPVFAPNGNGGWYSSLINSGFGNLLKEEGIEWLNVYGVDNVLQKICDPAFIGATILCKVNCSGKVVNKIVPEENVGVLCKEDGAPTVIEYYDMPKEQKYMRGADGKLTFRSGVILNYLFSVSKLNEVCGSRLPYHLAKKKVSCIINGEKVTPSEPNAYKFEILALDLVKLMGDCLAYEVVREREFAPVKNATGVDSVQSARELLQLNGVKL